LHVASPTTQRPSATATPIRKPLPQPMCRVRKCKLSSHQSPFPSLRLLHRPCTRLLHPYSSITSSQHRSPSARAAYTALTVMQFRPKKINGESHGTGQGESKPGVWQEGVDASTVAEWLRDWGPHRGLRIVPESLLRFMRGSGALYSVRTHSSTALPARGAASPPPPNPPSPATEETTFT
jgi:hypothetical protein